MTIKSIVGNRMTTSCHPPLSQNKNEQPRERSENSGHLREKEQKGRAMMIGLGQFLGTNEGDRQAEKGPARRSTGNGYPVSMCVRFLALSARFFGNWFIRRGLIVIVFISFHFLSLRTVRHGYTTKLKAPRACASVFAKVDRARKLYLLVCSPPWDHPMRCRKSPCRSVLFATMNAMQGADRHILLLPCSRGGWVGYGMHSEMQNTR